jgi:soluble lytic murein transglycosylase-like protein
MAIVKWVEVVGRVARAASIASVGLCLAAASSAGWTAGDAAGFKAGDHQLNAARLDDYRVRPSEGYALAPKYRHLLPPSRRSAAAEGSQPAQPVMPVIAGQSVAVQSGLVPAAASLRHALDLADKPFFREIVMAARAAALDPALVHAVIHVESGHRCRAVSPKGAQGLMQVMPDTGARYGIANLLTPGTNLRAGTLYLRDLMMMFNNRLDLVLAAYNAGEGAVQKYSNRIPPYRETQLYVRAVLAKYEEWRGAFSHADSLREAARNSPAPAPTRC